MDHTCQPNIQIRERRLTTQPYESPLLGEVYERTYHGGHEPQFEALGASPISTPTLSSPMSTVTLSSPCPVTTNSIASGSACLACLACCERRRSAAKTPPPPVNTARTARRAGREVNLTVMSSDMGGFGGWAEGQGMVVGGERGRTGERPRAATNQIQVFKLRLCFFCKKKSEESYTERLQTDRRSLQVKWRSGARHLAVRK